MDFSITNGIVSSKIYDKRGNFNFEIRLLISHFKMEMFLTPLPMVYKRLQPQKPFLTAKLLR